MKLVRIFVNENNSEGIWSIHLNGEEKNEFARFFDLTNDPEWLEDFFEKNEVNLMIGFFGRITIEGAVEKTLKEIEELEDVLFDYAEQGFTGGHNCLQHLFKPLNNFEHAITIHQKSKARIGNSWLRLYAIRLASNCYLVTGGGIKLTRDMRTEHFQNELTKLDQAKTFLRNNSIDYPEDLNTFQNE
jgi:hypothetical protein